MHLNSNYNINFTFQKPQLSNYRQNFRGLQTPIQRIKPATVSEQSKNAIKNIGECINKLKTLFEQLKTLSNNNPNRVIKYKSRYENFIPTQGKALTFKLKDWYMSVSQLEDHFGIIKIFTRKQNSSEPHLFLIEQDGQVYANASANNPRSFPKGARYMSEEQINDSRVETQVSVAEREISNFLKCMDEVVISLQNKQDGVLDPAIQTAMKDIINELNLIEQTTEKAKQNGWYNQKLRYWQQKFPTYVPQRAAGIGFVHKDGIINISKSETHEDLIRLSLKNRYNDKLKVFYIKDGEKVLSNVNMDYSYNIPRSYKYMSEEQINECGINKYIEFISTEIKDFREFFEEQFAKKTKSSK